MDDLVLSAGDGLRATAEGKTSADARQSGPATTEGPAPRVVPGAAVAFLVYLVPGHICVLAGVPRRRLPSVHRRTGLHSDHLVPRLGPPCAGSWPQPVLQQRTVRAHRGELGAKYLDPATRLGHRPIGPRAQPHRPRQSIDGPGLARVGDGWIRGAAEVAAMGSGGRSRWARLWVLSLHGEPGCCASGADLRTDPTVHCIDGRGHPAASRKVAAARRAARAARGGPVSPLLGDPDHSRPPDRCRVGLRGPPRSGAGSRDGAHRLGPGRHRARPS